MKAVVLTLLAILVARVAAGPVDGRAEGVILGRWQRGRTAEEEKDRQRPG